MIRACRFLLAVALCLSFVHPSWAAGADEKKRAQTRFATAGTTAAFDPAEARDLACGSVSDSTNAAAPSRMASYSCAEFDESGGEVIYRIVLANHLEVDAVLDQLQDDLDLFLLDASRSDACIAASAGVSSERILSCLAPGTYYLVVDGFAGAVSSFRLQLGCAPCQPCSPAAENDTCDGAVQLMPRDVATRLAGNTRCAADDYDGAACTGYTSAGRDVVYRVSMPPGCGIRVTLRDGSDGVPVDRSVYLASSCDDVPGTCVAGSDAGVEGDESFTYESAEGGIFFLIVDAFGHDEGGDFELEVVQTNCSVVSSRAASWQQLKQLYR